MEDAKDVLFKQIAIYCLHVCSRNNIIPDACHESVLMIKVVIDVLEHVYCIKSPPADLILRIIIDASVWLNKAYDDARHEIVDEAEDGSWVDVWDQRWRFALCSGPSLPNVTVLQCNERDITPSPCPFLSWFDYTGEYMLDVMADHNTVIDELLTKYNIANFS